MTSKDFQKEVIVEILKPLFKKWGYKTNGQHWWKVTGDFFQVICLQNFSWNTRDSVDFCFNFSTGLLKDISGKTKVTTHDGITYTRECTFLSGKETRNRNKLGYHLTPRTDINNFKNEIKCDFEGLILPKLDSLNSADALLSFYREGFFADRLRQALNNNG